MAKNLLINKSKIKNTDFFGAYHEAPEIFLETYAQCSMDITYSISINN